jgi:hypothetical protein
LAATIGLERESTERVSTVDHHCGLPHLLGHEPGNSGIAVVVGEHYKRGTSVLRYRLPRIHYARALSE